MTGLAVALNNVELVTVSTEGLNVLGVRVFGDVLGPEFASIDVSGGLYGEGDNSKHLTWIDLHDLSPGDEITVSLINDATTSFAGKTIEELYPEQEQPMGPWQPLEVINESLLKQAKIRDGFTFMVTPPTGSPITARTEPNDHSFGFSVMWNWLNPERVRVSLSSNSLQNIIKRTGGTYQANFLMHVGEGVKLRVAA